MLNSKTSISTPEKTPIKIMLRKLLPPSMKTSTGPSRDKSHPSKIKDHVDHAGLSVLLLFWSHGLFQNHKKLTFPNNSLLIAANPTETTVAMEVSTTRVLLMSKTTESPLSQLTPILPRPEPAKFKEVTSKSLKSTLLRDAPMFKMPFKADPSVSQLMPLTGADTPAVFSATAEETLTTISNSSASPAHSTKLRTHGEPVGEKMDSLDLPLETLAVSATISHLGFSDS